MNWIFSKTKGDIWIWLVVAFLSLISLLAVYSSTGTLAYKFQSGNTEYYLFKHLSLMIVGLVLMWLAHLLDYRYYSRISQILIFISIPLLLYTLLFGSEINQASRWISIPFTGQTFQTSDLAKLALIMYLARELSRRQENIKDFKKSFVPIILSVTFIIGLIAPANFSTALMLFGTASLIMLIGRVSFKQISLSAIAVGLILVIVVFFGPRRETYRSRINTFLNHEQVDADKSYQSDHAKIAIATGGIFGKGPGGSTEQNFLPQAYSDFIFTIIIEEYGLVGGALVILAYLFFLYRSIRIITKAPKAFGALLACGLSFSLVIQAFANMAVAVNLMPVTGVPLPLVSMGGTSILFTSIAFGIILSVSRDVEEMQQTEKTDEAA
ncbi:MAG: FtsW/RodA/SpoVE family cell cycle protein [Sphingobacteriales bacterium]|jgi:cell division protein FtsW|nr:FtsW/RodA/SpoVE family cell cycle protein [Sphingobacteriales bacterium]